MSTFFAPSLRELSAKQTEGVICVIVKLPPSKSLILPPPSMREGNRLYLYKDPDKLQFVKQKWDADLTPLAYNYFFRFIIFLAVTNPTVATIPATAPLISGIAASKLFGA